MMGIAELKALLPHRYPILQIDRVCSIDTGVSIVAEKAVTHSEPCYADLVDDAAPAAYAYPVSLMLESVGQAGCVLWMHARAAAGHPTGGSLIFGAASGVTVHAPVYPGDVIRHVAQLTSVKGDTAILSARSTVGDRLVLTLDTMIALQREVDDLAPRPRTGSGSGTQEGTATPIERTSS